MGLILGADMDAHLCAGGTVVAASDRAARAILASFHRARRAEGREAWPTPRVFDWKTFLQLTWEERAPDARLVLNPNQEQSLWERVIKESGEAAAHLIGPRRNLASLAAHAHALLCSYAPRSLDSRARSSWDQDAAVFSRWLSAFEALCREHDVVSTGRVALKTIELLSSSGDNRQPLLLVGFDRLLPIQHQFLDAWGGWNHVSLGEQAASTRFLAASDPGTELSSCVAWCMRRLGSAPESTILVLAQDLQQRRGEIERAFLGDGAQGAGLPFEFSLGVPLSRTDAVRSALMLLRWLDSELAEHELDWLFSTPYAAATAEETAALRAAMRRLRGRGLQRTQWSLTTFLAGRGKITVPEQWAKRMLAAQNRLRSVAHRALSPAEWAETVPELLETIGWPGAFTSTSAEFQVMRRWRSALETCASLGFDRRRIDWQAFLAELRPIADETLFAPESEGAPILIAGPAESAGLSADAIWLLGAEENAWPARGEFHPLLPAEVQRNSAMPHSTPQLDWELARAVTLRLLASAPEVNFSYARQRDGVDARPSRLVAESAGAPQPLPDQFLPIRSTQPLTHAFEDVGAIPHPAATSNGDAAPSPVRGGAGLLTAQSRCPFQAFATARLGASKWDPAATGLSAGERGKILHAVLHSVWAGPPGGIHTHEELLAVTDPRQFVLPHVRNAMAANLPSRAREQMPARYLELEERRLTRLISEWLEYEKTREEFTVMKTELKATPAIAGLSLDLRLDRLDLLNDGTMFVIDYKTGNVSPNSWDLPRPDDVQLPLYAAFGLNDSERVGGLVFAKVRAGEMCFEGRVSNAAATLNAGLKGTSSLVKYPMTADQLENWRDAIEQLARDFLAGRADVDPRDPVKTCKNCGLQTICRIQTSGSEDSDSETESEALDE